MMNTANTNIQIYDSRGTEPVISCHFIRVYPCPICGKYLFRCRRVLHQLESIQQRIIRRFSYEYKSPIA